MKPEELRIGNYVTLTEKLRQEMWDNKISAYNEYFKVDVIYSDGDIVLELDNENVDFESKDISPIELTEEWILKLGFEKRTNYQYVNKAFIIESWTYKNTFYLRLRQSEESSVVICEMKYVHQLQNLYFALTGEELTIKNEA